MATAEVCKEVNTQQIFDLPSKASKKDNEARKKKRITLISALKKKYSAAAMRTTNCIIFMASNAPGKTATGSFNVPENLILNSFNITSAGAPEDIAQHCADVVELDLTENNIRSWQEVFNILDCIPRLEFLNLTKNPLEQLHEADGPRYPGIKKLALNFTYLSWNSLRNLLTVMPCLEELYLSENSFEEVQLESPPYETLRLLQLTSNKISEWRHVELLDRVFPNLHSLIVASNDITTCGCEDTNAALFRRLTSLNMNNTSVCHWDELDKLSCIASLKDIRLSSIPLLEEFDQVKRRQMLSVYFPDVERLNGSALLAEEKDTAERVFLRHFMDESVKPKRYSLLEAKHGRLDPLASVNLAPQETVMMTVVCDDKEDVFDIPTKQTIGQLKKSLRSYTGAGRFRLYHDNGTGPALIRSSNRFVWGLNFRDGEKLVCVLDPSSPVKTSSGSS